ncbi:MAG: DUF5916 domain-containing protein [Vicinamibacterales bacterium]
MFRDPGSTTLALVPLLVLGSAPAVAQDPPSHLLHAVRLEHAETLRLDGAPDERAWQRAAPATGFVQRDPDNGAPATERTEVRIVYDDTRLVLGVVCFDSEPGRLLANQMQRDQSFEADDRFMWTIDSFLDGRSGYFFEINPSGAMGDGLIDPAGNEDDLGADVNRSWDGIWTARVRRTAVGWTAEIEIPFRTLNFDPASPAWGINFQRTIRRKNEETLWTGHARNQGVARMSSAGRVTGFSQISQGIGLDLKPYVVGSAVAEPGRGRAGTVATGDAGLDVFYNITPALRANLSLNTDFAETEVDERRVNLTRFPLFFEEKRDFFLEGSSFFDFGREPGEAVVPFFSRRIGLDEDGAPQRIDAGAKLTGQAGPFDLGVLQVRTGETGAHPGEDFSVMRVRRRALRQSYVGGLYTRRSARRPGDVDRHTVGADVELQTSTFRGDRNLELSGLWLWTSSPLGAGESGAWAVRVDYPNDPLSARLSFRELEDHYDPAVGFVERRGYRRMNPAVEWRPRPRNHRWIRSFELGANIDLQNDTANRPLTREWQLTMFDVNLHSGDSVRLEVTPTYERLEEDFEISDGVLLPSGARYRFTRYDLGVFTSDHRVATIEGQVQFGRFFSGTRREYVLEMEIRPRRGVRLGIEAEHNVVDLPEGHFEADVYRAWAGTQFSPWMSLSNNVQYDTESRLLGWQMRFRWIRRPGNDVYFVYTHNWVEPDRAAATFDRLRPRRFATLDRRAAMKAVYTLRF